MSAIPARWRHALTLLLAVLALASGGCTTLGVHTGLPPRTDAPPVTLNVCLLREPSIGDARVEALLAAANDEFAPHGIRIAAPWVRAWQRPGFTHEAIVDDLVRRPLEAPCDRLMALVGRTLADAAWGAFMPEVLGGVESATHTRGFSVAVRASVGQLFQSPEDTFVHELYHLLGCQHGLTLSACHAAIAALREQARQQPSMFPTLARGNRLLTTRHQVDTALGRVAQRASVP